MNMFAVWGTRIVGDTKKKAIITTKFQYLWYHHPLCPLHSGHVFNFNHYLSNYFLFSVVSLKALCHFLFHSACLSRPANPEEPREAAKPTPTIHAHKHWLSSMSSTAGTHRFVLHLTTQLLHSLHILSQWTACNVQQLHFSIIFLFSLFLFFVSFKSCCSIPFILWCRYENWQCNKCRGKCNCNNVIWKLTFWWRRSNEKKGKIFS